MKRDIALIAAVLISASVGAQNTNLVAIDEGRPLNRFGLSYRPGFNIHAKFKNIGSFSSGADPGPATSGVDHNYDDGYNRVDSSGNRNNQTWNWGYDRADQIVARPGPDALALSTTIGGGGSKDADADVMHGAELTYQRELGKIDKVYWGVEATFNYNTGEFKDSSRANVTRVTDLYSLGGIIPPQAPYRGSFQGPGPVISDIPSRSITPISIPGSRKLEVDMYGFHLGPYIEWPFADKWSALFSGGLAVASINSDFSFREQVGGVTERGSGSHSDWNFGGYVNANIIYNISETVDVFAGAQFQYLGDYDHKVAGRKAELDLGQSIFAVVGVGFSF